MNSTSPDTTVDENETGLVVTKHLMLYLKPDLNTSVCLTRYLTYSVDLLGRGGYCIEFPSAPLYCVY